MVAFFIVNLIVVNPCFLTAKTSGLSRQVISIALLQEDLILPLRGLSEHFIQKVTKLIIKDIWLSQCTRTFIAAGGFSYAEI